MASNSGLAGLGPEANRSLALSERLFSSSRTMLRDVIERDLNDAGAKALTVVSEAKRRAALRRFILNGGFVSIDEEQLIDDRLLCQGTNVV
mmetsp:Transcript_27399/g.40463  ORF Transcript_27399/g.40463 Transcript_27399/m.40463 type:complete len:91 (+) Transcript_27399:943-1215(+)